MFDCPARLSLFGPSQYWKRLDLEKALKTDKIAKAGELRATKAEADKRRAAVRGLQNGGSTAGLPAAKPAWLIEDEKRILEQQRNAPGWKGEAAVAEPTGPSLADIMAAGASSAVGDHRPAADQMRALAAGDDGLSRMPSASQPDQLSSRLLPYQLQALEWLRSRENPVLSARGSPTAVQLWKHQANGRYRNIATDYSPSGAPTLLSGGILADDMGLGKTLEVISLIISPDGDQDQSRAQGKGKGKGKSQGKHQGRGTLIVAPVSVMSNWEQQIRRHVLPDHQPSVLIYHGQKRPTEGRSLADYDVVITSYGKLSIDPALSDECMHWRRLVLDEGHTIRNARTKAAVSACKVTADSRWVLTGTPM